MRELAPGVVVASYRIDSLIGRGGMGVVYRAFQVGLDRLVALKVIAPELLDDEDVRRRFLSEARAAASVDHPNVIPVHDAGEDNGVAYIAMRYVDGDDLRTLVRRGGALDPAEAADLVAQAGAALDAIHRAGFVHRDVKPANLLVDRDRHVYLTDFGLAKAVLTRTDGTRTGQWVGTLDYVAPEQIRGGRIDARADIYALGGVLHYALTGKVPFVRDGDEAKLWAQLSAPPPLPSSLRRGLRGEFDATVARAMAKTPDGRYPSAGDLGRAARAAALGRSPTEPERMVARGAAAPDAAPSEPGLAADAETRTARPVPAQAARGGRRWLLAGGLAAAAVAAVVIVLALQPGDPPSVASTPTATPTATTTPTASPTPTATPAERLPRVAKLIRRIGDRPNGIALAGGDLWVTSTRAQRLTRINTKTGHERANHPKVGNRATGIVGYRDNVWVAIGPDRVVHQLDAKTGRIRRSLAVPGEPRRLAVDRTGAWVGTNSVPGQGGTLIGYDVRTGERRHTIAVPEGVGPVVTTPKGVYVVRRDTAGLARVSGDRLVDIVGLPGKVRSMRYAAHAIWMVLEEEDTVAKYAMNGRGPYTASAGHAPMQALVAGGRLFVANRNDQAVLVLDPRTLRPSGAPLEVGVNPLAMVADGRSVWVTVLGENAVARIDYR